MKKAICTVFSCFFLAGAFAQNVAYINEKPVSVKEFIWVYKKNHSGSSNATLAELESYLDLYIHFKLKALDAREQGLQNEQDYITEVKNYEHALLSQKKISGNKKEYELIMAEYKDAVLMFTLSESKIWKRSQNDTVALLNFYQKSTSSYQSKPFAEVKTLVISDYQKYLEAEWIAQLLEKHKVTVNKAELKKLAKL